MKPTLNTGIQALIEGFAIAKTPEIRPFVIIPLTINFILFGGLIYWGYGEVSQLNDYLLDYIPSWLSWLTWIIFPLFFLLALVFVMYGFSVIANFIASPFNGLLAEKVEEQLTGKPVDSPNDFKTLALLIPRSIGREVKKMLYYLPLLIGALIITFIPGINIFAPIIWFALNAWMMNIQYLDYPMDNHQLSFADVKNTSKQNRLCSLGFGGTIMLITVIPLANLVIMPIAVCGATSLWVKQYQRNSQVEKLIE
jgi:CysZ protein